MAKRPKPSKPSKARAEPRVGLKVDIEGVHPDSVSPTSLLALASSYFDVLSEVGDDVGADLKLHGVEIVDGCVEVQSRAAVSAAASLEDALSRIVYYSQTAPPKGLKEKWTRFVDARSEFGRDAKIEALLDGRRFVLQEQSAPNVAPPRSITDLRCRVLRVGGRRPAARFESASERRPFSFGITLDQARDLGGLVYEEVDVVAEVERDSLGFIVGGDLVRYTRLDTGDAGDAWRKWFKENALDLESANFEGSSRGAEGD